MKNNRRKLYQILGLVFSLIIPVGIFIYLTTLESLDWMAWVFYGIIFVSIVAGTYFYQARSKVCSECGQKMTEVKEELLSKKQSLRSKKPRLVKTYEKTMECVNCHHQEVIRYSKEETIQ